MPLSSSASTTASKSGYPKRDREPIMTIEDSSTYWKRSRVELRAAGFDPDKSAATSAVVTIASAWTNAHRCNNRVRTISDLLIEILAERGGQGLVVGAPA